MLTSLLLSNLDPDLDGSFIYRFNVTILQNGIIYHFMGKTTLLSTIGIQILARQIKSLIELLMNGWFDS
jgi:hypothetical protein